MNFENIKTARRGVTIMDWIGLAVTDKEFELIKKRYNPYNVYHITDWDNLGEIKGDSTVLLFSRDWFSLNGINAADNLASFYSYYESFGIYVYYIDLHFNVNSHESVNELIYIVDCGFYNILIGEGEMLRDILIRRIYDFDRDYWVEWVEQLNNEKVVNDEEKEKDFIASFCAVIQRTFNYVCSIKFDLRLERFRISKIHFNWELVKTVYLKGGLCIFVGAMFGVMGIKPLVEMGLNNRTSVSEWEEFKAQQQEAFIPQETPTLDDSKSTMQTGDFIGLIKLPNKSNAVGVRLGTTDAILNKGAGLDETSADKLVQRGNAVVYGHREEVFWELKDIKKGDIITVETLEGEFKYEVKKTRVTKPDDETIYQYSRKHLLTLVTCYPFVYMGATPERFVVEAELIEVEVSETN